MSHLLPGAFSSLRLRGTALLVVIAAALAVSAIPAAAMTDAGDGSTAATEEFADQSDAQALETAQEEHPDTAARPEDEAVSLPDGARIAGYRSDTVAEVALPDGERALLDSQWPLVAATPGGAEGPVDMELVQRDGALEPRRAPTRVRLPDELDAGVSFPGTGIRIEVPDASPSADAVETGGQAFYANAIAGADNVDVIARPTISGGVEFSWQLRSEDSPEHLPLDFDLPAGMTIEAAPAGGGLVIRRGDEIVGAVRAPAAWDANNQPVESWLTVDDGRVTMHVPHRGSGAALPIIADPVVEIWMSWEGGAATDYDGWEYSEQNNQVTWSALQAGSSPFGSRTWDTSSGSSFAWIRGGSGWGTGLAIIACCNRAYGAGKRGTWSYKAPRDSYVYRADYAYIDHRLDNSKLRAGIRNIDGTPAAGQYNAESTSNLVAGPYETTGAVTNAWRTVCTSQNCHSGIGNSSNAAVFEVEMTSYRYDPISAVQAGGANVFLMDRDTPRLATSATHGSGWLKAGDRVDISATADDKASDNAQGGLGIRKFVARPPAGSSVDKWIRSDGATLDQESGACLGIRSSRCPVAAGASWSLEVKSDWPEGTVSIPVDVVDATGAHTDTKTVSVQADARPPAITLSGPITGSPVEADRYLLSEDSQLDFSAADGGTGVAKLEVVIDGHVQSTTTCSGAPCQGSYALNLSNKALFDDTDVVVRATDANGNVGTSPLRVRVEPFDADVDLDSGLVPDPIDGIADGCSPDEEIGPDAYCSTSDSNAVSAITENEPEVGEERPDLASEPDELEAQAYASSGGSLLSVTGPSSTGWGISDNEMITDPTTGQFTMFRDARLAQTGIKSVRFTVPFDLLARANGTAGQYKWSGCGLYDRTKDITISSQQDRNEANAALARFNTWVSDATTRGYAVMISLWYASDYPDGNLKTSMRCFLPLPTRYKTIVEPLIAHFRARGVKLFTAWNEPNDVTTGPRYYPSGVGIRRAGQYWRQLNEICDRRSCSVAAGDFASKRLLFQQLAEGSSATMMDKYIEGLGDRPTVWAYHPYTEGFKREPDLLKAYIKRIRRRNGGNAPRLWLDEFGGRYEIHRKAGLSRGLAEYRANGDLSYILNDLLPAVGKIDAIVSRMLPYEWQQYWGEFRGSKRTFDTALIRQDGQPRQMLCTLFTRIKGQACPYPVEQLEGWPQ